MVIAEQRTPLSCALHPLPAHFLSAAFNLPVNSNALKKPIHLAKLFARVNSLVKLPFHPS